ncbi:MAG: [FeFe] hydrogenase H-cluster maturation GTPase HydF [Eubacterium sp.]|nr:[FeFe] hydrogenase H-cluster maturation GTPase HydF [Eubacterium sp.]
MSMNETPSSERVQIGFFGRRNAGKSSVINCLTGQSLSVVSSVPGTTTDPVRKAMEIHGLGPCVVIDTAGLDDTGELGLLRVRKTRDMMERIDLAVIVIGDGRIAPEEEELENWFREKKIPFILCFNKQDLGTPENMPADALSVSAKTGAGFDALTAAIRERAKAKIQTAGMLDDLISEKDTVVMVIPMDAEAPKGRIILPQQMVLHELLLHHATACVCQTEELADVLEQHPHPRMVITDSQAFYQVRYIVPEDVPLTSFSILMARYRGYLGAAVQGVREIEKLQDGDTVLVAEGCTHRRTCGDIGSVKIPALLEKYTGKKLQIALSSGSTMQEDLSGCKLVIHCGGCVLNDREMESRRNHAFMQGTPITNYGIAVAYMRGILGRSLRMLPEFAQLAQELPENDAQHNSI